MLSNSMSIFYAPKEIEPHTLRPFCRLFYGRSRQTIFASTEPGKSESTNSVKEDIFAQLLVNVSDEGLDLYDGLSAFLDDTVEFEGRQAEMEIDLLELPPILQIQLQVRFFLILRCPGWQG